MSPPITAVRLAEETGVSLRSLYRDIDTLRAAGARIDGERGYGYRLIEDYSLPPQAYSREEIEAIALGMAEVKHMGDPVLAEAAISVLAKVSATLPDRSEQYLLHAISQVYRPSSRYPETGHINLLRQACWNEEALQIRYEDRDGSVSDRKILPLAIMYTEKTLSVLSWCCLRQAFRMFRVDRIIGAGSLGASFRPRRAALLRDYLDLLRKEDDRLLSDVAS
jgi:predicted DNA-binding transcriptional regulator YafY